MANIALVQLNAIERALTQARSVDEVITIINSAEAMRQCFRLAHYGLEMQNEAAEAKLRAERRAGEMLAEMEKHPPGPEPQDRSHDVTDPPTYDELSIGKMQASRWQAEARVPEDEFEQYIAKTKAADKELTSAGLRRLEKQLARSEQQRQKAEEYEQAIAKGTPWPELVQLYCGDFADVGPTLESESIDVIVTDPPYAAEHLHLYGLLAEQAQRLLKPGGSLLAMAGQSHLPNVLAQILPHLAYHWTLAYLTPGGQSPQIWPRKINAFWKPVFWFVKGEYQGDWHGDVFKSDINDNDKRFHDWGQSESGIGRLVDAFCSPDTIVLDPFVGGGTTAVVCYRFRIPFIGIDIDEDKINVTKARIIEETTNA